MADPLGPVTAVVMARRPVPGKTKTRLTKDGWCNDEQAAAVALAMMRCTARRLQQVFGEQHVVLALTPDGDGRVTGLEQIRYVSQGSGDLGARLVHVWKTLGAHTPLVFLGIDSPDVPMAALAAMGDFARSNEAREAIWIGPAMDGGFWAIGGARLLPDVFANIDWGTNVVYDQMCANATAAGLEVVSGEQWFDVDFGPDVEALLERLGKSGQSDALLSELQQELSLIVGKARTDKRRH